MNSYFRNRDGSPHSVLPKGVQGNFVTRALSTIAGFAVNDNLSSKSIRDDIDTEI